MKQTTKIKNLFIIGLISLMLASCTATIEQAEKLEALGKNSEAAATYWNVLSGAETLSADRNKASDALIRLKDDNVKKSFRSGIESLSPEVRDATTKLVAKYQDKTLYSILADALFYEGETPEVLNKLVSTILSVNDSSVIDSLIEKSSSTPSKNIAYLPYYYEILGRSQMSVATDKLIAMLAATPLYFEDDLVKAMSYTGDVRVVQPLLKYIETSEGKNKKQIAEIFMQFNNDDTFGFIIEELAADDILRTKATEYFKGKLEVTHSDMLENLIINKGYDLLNPVTQFSVYLLSEYSDLRSLDTLVKLVDLKPYERNDALDKEIVNVLNVIADIGGVAKLYRIFEVLGQNLSLPITHSYFGFPGLFEVGTTLAKKSKKIDDDLISYMYTMRDLAFVYRSKQRVKGLAKDSDRITTVPEIRNILHKVISLSNDIQRYIPMDQLLSNALYYIDNIDELRNQKEAKYLLGLSGFEGEIKVDRVFKPIKYDVKDVLEVKKEAQLIEDAKVIIDTAKKAEAEEKAEAKKAESEKIKKVDEKTEKKIETTSKTNNIEKTDEDVSSTVEKQGESQETVQEKTSTSATESSK
jgi:hypothetical protein